MHEPNQSPDRADAPTTIRWERADEPEYLYQSVCGRFLVAPFEVVGGLSLLAAEDPCASLCEAMSLAEITAEATRLAPGIAL